MKKKFIIILTVFLALSFDLIWAQGSNFPANYNLNEYNLNSFTDQDFENSLDKLCNIQLLYPDNLKKDFNKTAYKTPQPLKKKFFENVTLMNIVNISDELSELNDPTLAALLVSSGYLLEHDVELYKSISNRINKYDKNDWSGKLTYLGEGFVDLGICGLLYSFSKNPRDKEIAQMGAEAVTIAGLQTQWLKRFFGFPRPAWYNDGERHLGFSIKQDAMPSGHTACAFAIATVLGEAYNAQWIAYPIAAVAALTRITEHAHWPSDDLIGGLIGHLAARKILINHGFLQPIDPVTSWRNDKTYIEINSSLENYNDNNSNFSSFDKQGERFGHLKLFGQAGKKFYSKILTQAAYQYDRQTYNITHVNDSQGKLIAFRISGVLSPKAILFGDLKYKDIQYQDVNDLNNYLSFINSYENTNYGFGLIYQLSSSFSAKIKYNTLNRFYHPFDTQFSSAKLLTAGLGSSVSKKDAPFQWEVLYQREINPANSAEFSYLANHLIGSVSEEFKNWGTLSVRLHKQNKFFTDTVVTGTQIKREDVFKWGEISFKRDFKTSWSAELKYILCRLNTNQIDSGYSKNMYMLNLTKNF